MIRKCKSYSSRCFTRTDFLVSLAAIGIIILLIMMLFPGGPVSREIPNRTLCSANIRVILSSMAIYAQSNNGNFPCVSGPVTPDGRYGNSALDMPANINGVPGVSQNTKYVVSQWYTNANSAATGAGSPLGSLWLLVLQGQDTPKSFICPSDPIANGMSFSEKINGGYFGNFGFLSYSDTSPNSTGRGESYSICFPYAYKANASAVNPEVAGDWWVNDTRADQPIVSDMAPLSDASVYSAGTGALVTDAPVSNIGFATFYRNTTVLPTNNTYGPYIYNSGNHNGDGQNVGFADGHVEWVTNPYVGVQGDNIFTFNNSKPYNPNTGGTPLTGTGTSNAGITSKFQPQSPPYDTVMVPVRNVQNGDW